MMRSAHHAVLPVSIHRRESPNHRINEGFPIFAEYLNVFDVREVVHLHMTIEIQITEHRAKLIFVVERVNPSTGIDIVNVGTTIDQSRQNSR